MSELLFEIFVLLFLIFLNGIFAMAEMALVSVRKARLKQRADDGDIKVAETLALLQNPTRFLSTTQVGITLVGIIAGVFAGATIAGKVASTIEWIPWVGRFAEEIGFAIVVVCVTLLSLIFGELIPKRIALVYAEPLALAITRPMAVLSAATSPFIWLLTRCTDGILSLFRIYEHEEPSVTEDELKVILDQGQEAGVIEEAEKKMVERVLEIGERRLLALMTPREDVKWINTEDPPSRIWDSILSSEHTYLPVCEGSFDRIRGVISMRHFIGKEPEWVLHGLREHLQQPLYVPDTTTALRLLEELKSSQQHLALVVDEHGVFEGLITLMDILEDIVGELGATTSTEGDPSVVQRDDGSWLIDGRYPLSDLQALLGFADLPEGSNREFHTLSGMVMAELGAVPTTGSFFSYAGYRFEVVDMDGRRVDKVLVLPQPAEV